MNFCSEPQGHRHNEIKDRAPDLNVVVATESLDKLYKKVDLAL